MKGKVAIVTGATVYISGRTDESNLSDFLPQFIRDITIQKTVEEINKIGGIGIAHKCDHRNAEDVKELFERIISEQGKIDYYLIMFGLDISIYQKAIFLKHHFGSSLINY